MKGHANMNNKREFWSLFLPPPSGEHVESVAAPSVESIMVMYRTLLNGKFSATLKFSEKQGTHLELLQKVLFAWKHLRDKHHMMPLLVATSYRAQKGVSLRTITLL